MWIVRRPTSRPTARRSAVADRRVDLAGDLGDRHAERHGQVELDIDLRAEVDGDAGMGQPEAFQEALVRAGREPGDAVRSERRRSHDVDDSLAGDQRSAGAGSVRHARVVLLA